MRRGRAGHDFQIGAPSRRGEIAFGRAHSPPAFNGCLDHGNAVLIGAVVIRVPREAYRFRCREKRVIERKRLWDLGYAEGAVASACGAVAKIFLTSDVVVCEIPENEAMIAGGAGAMDNSGYGM